MLGTRHTSKKEVVEFNNETKINVGTCNETAQFGELLVLAVKGTEMPPANGVLTLQQLLMLL